MDAAVLFVIAMSDPSDTARTGSISVFDAPDSVRTAGCVQVQIAAIIFEASSPRRHFEHPVFRVFTFDLSIESKGGYFAAQLQLRL
ncbi:MAG: hypothetical protein ABJX82_18610 [Paracoccaceae bacterium]